MLLWPDPAVYEAPARWAGDELRSADAQIEFPLRQAPADAGRRPTVTGPGRADPQPVGSPAFPASAHASPTGPRCRDLSGLSTERIAWMRPPAMSGAVAPGTPPLAS
ncbi:hypothetical protein [Streptomyces sp. GbtcB6]|uniref:hypothetical protein n=1 Tax=Streptomyces sp. GbtcB6 TaxID=2824751 RepID=UPI0027E4C167|nr:hypothetical protein [Streptomyces sp. GbtcB6]